MLKQFLSAGATGLASVPLSLEQPAKSSPLDHTAPSPLHHAGKYVSITKVNPAQWNEDQGSSIEKAILRDTG